MIAVWLVGTSYNIAVVQFVSMWSNFIIKFTCIQSIFFYFVDVVVVADCLSSILCIPNLNFDERITVFEFVYVCLVGSWQLSIGKASVMRETATHGSGPTTHRYTRHTSTRDKEPDGSSYRTITYQFERYFMRAPVLICCSWRYICLFVWFVFFGRIGKLFCVLDYYVFGRPRRIWSVSSGLSGYIVAVFTKAQTLGICCTCVTIPHTSDYDRSSVRVVHLKHSN